MLKIDRHRLIENEINKYGSVLISEMSKKLSCSEETIRRDLKYMEDRGKLKRIHGGAFLPNIEDKGAPVNLKKSIISDVKQRLANYILEHYIKENDIIMLDCSTTCLSLAQSIFDKNIGLTIITNSLDILNLFKNQTSLVKAVAIGGEFRQRSNSFVGYQATNSIKHYLADKCFISSSAIDKNHGLLDNNLNESQIKKSFVEHSRQHILIADYTKFYDTADYIICNLSEIDIIISDKKLSQEWEDLFKKNNLHIEYC